MATEHQDAVDGNDWLLFQSRLHPADYMILPPELRGIIWGMVLTPNQTHNTTPPLIAALRHPGNLVLYYEALGAFYANYSFFLGAYNYWTLGNTTATAARTIKSINISLTKWIFTHQRYQSNLINTIRRMHNHNVSKLTLDLDLFAPFTSGVWNYETKCDFIVGALEEHLRLKMIVLYDNGIRIRNEPMPPRNSIHPMTKVTRIIDSRTHRPGVISSMDWCVVWEAGPGEQFVW